MPLSATDRDAFEALAEVTTQTIWVADAKGAAEYQSRQFQVYTGRESHETLGDRWASVIHPGDLPKLVSRWHASVSARVPFEFEYRLRRRDGEYRWHRAKAVLSTGPGDAPCWFGTLTDVEDQKRDDRARSRVTGVLWAVSDEVTDAVIVTDADGACLFCNPAAAGLAGRSAGELLGRGLNDLFAPDSARLIAARSRAVLSGHRIEATEEPLTIRGVTRTYHTIRAPYRNEAGAVFGVIGIYRDITERRHAEAAARLFRALIDRTTDAIAVIDPPTGQFLDVNETACRATGYSREEYLVMRMPDIDPAAGPWPGPLFRAPGTNHVFESRHRRKDGSTYPVEVSLNVVNLDREYLVAVVRDVTERKRLEDQFYRSQKMEAVGRLAGGIAHDFNNLLTVIGGYSHLVLEQTAPDAPWRDDLVEIYNAGRSAADLTRQLLIFSRPTAQELSVVDSNDLIRGTEKLLARLIGEDVTLSTQLDPNVSPVLADPTLMEQALVNLCVNARDAMPGGGKLAIRTREVNVSERPGAAAGRYVVITVADTGHGMDAATRARAFEPFFTTKEVGKGTGLGLAMVYGFARQVGGFVELHSEPGLGATCELFLPRTGEAQRRDVPDPQPAPHGRETVLLVEDEIAVRAFVARVLRRYGYNVLEARDGPDARRAALAHGPRIDLLISDVVMPGGMNGRKVAEAVRVPHPEARVLYISGYPGDALAPHGVRPQQLNFLHKPFTRDALARKVREVLDADESSQLI